MVGMKKKNDILTVEDFIGTAVEVRSEAEYHMVIAAYSMLGCPGYPWHKGYVKIDPDNWRGVPIDGKEPHHLYGWEQCGFIKHIGGFSTMSGTFTSPTDLVLKAMEVLNLKIITDSKLDLGDPGEML